MLPLRSQSAPELTTRMADVLPNVSLFGSTRKGNLFLSGSRSWLCRQPSSRILAAPACCGECGPFDVLGSAEVRFDPPTQLRELHDLRVCQHLLLPLRRLDRLFMCSTCRRGVDGALLGGDRLGDNNRQVRVVCPAT
jgi:hypothetical protein